MHDTWIEFGKVALVHLLAVASPGPDFAIVLRQSLAHGRRTALWTSVGVGTAILLHVTYSLFGIGLLITGSTGLWGCCFWGLPPAWLSRNYAKTRHLCTAVPHLAQKNPFQMSIRWSVNKG